MIYSISCLHNATYNINIQLLNLFVCHLKSYIYLFITLGIIIKLVSNEYLKIIFKEKNIKNSIINSQIRINSN